MAYLVFGGSRGVKVVSFFRFFFQHVFSDVLGVMPDPKLGHNCPKVLQNDALNANSISDRFFGAFMADFWLFF